LRAEEVAHRVLVKTVNDEPLVIVQLDVAAEWLTFKSTGFPNFQKKPTVPRSVSSILFNGPPCRLESVSEVFSARSGS